MNSKKSIPGLILAAVLLIAGPSVFAGGSREPVLPVITLSGDEEVYISPAASLGDLDEIELSYSVAPGSRRRITQINIAVNDSEGNAVWYEEYLIEPPSREPIESSFIWEGKNSNSSYVDDGTYGIEIQAQDNRGNQGASRMVQVYVDNTPPKGEARFPYRVFSPNEDGEKDLFLIEQDGSKEAEWAGIIKDKSGNVVYEQTWQQAAPGDFSWDGTDRGGALLPDGEYTYTISSRDNAGNFFRQDYPNIIIDTTDTEIQLQSDGLSFSPNDDGIKDSINIESVIRNRESILGWSYSINDQQNEAVYLLEKDGTVEIPEVFVFEGRDSRGELLPEGRYTGVLEVLYSNGNNPAAATAPLDLDITPPAAAVAAEPDIFSPNGDGKKDTVAISQTTGPAATWQGEILDAEGRAVLSYSWQEQPEETLTWNGRDQNGALVPDGQYVYRLQGSDDAGNQVLVTTEPFRVSTINPENLRLSASDTVFSPNNDGVKDTVLFHLDFRGSGDVENFEFVLLDERSAPVYREEGNETAQRTIEWNGTDGTGGRVAEGLYNARLTAHYRSGDQLSRTAGPVRVDVTKPDISVELSNTVFSPDKEGNRGRIVIFHESSEEDTWQGMIENAAGEALFRYAWRGKTTDVYWDGTDEEGTRVPDGVYRYLVSSTDEAGNRTSVSLEGITVVTTPERIPITREPDAFSPNNDGIQDTIAFTMDTEEEKTILYLRVTVITARGKAVRKLVVPAEGLQPISAEWDGLSDNGSAAEEGEYSALFSVLYEDGNVIEYELEQPFYLDLTAPEAELVAAPLPFSPDEDGVDDTVEFSLTAADVTGIGGWSGTLYDPRGGVFVTYSGVGHPAGPLEWDGRAEDGELVQAASDYTLELKVQDRAGNIRTVSRSIPVDVFITRDEGLEKIMISSILFPPRSSDFRAVSKEQAEINKEVLDRVAEVLQSFEGHSITVVGYAVSMLWADPEAAAEEQREILLPLSLSRAEAVMDALIRRGIDAERLSVEGRGGRDPVVPHGAFEEHWKNRRVEFRLKDQGSSAADGK